MLYLSRFELPSLEMEEGFLGSIRRTCYTSVYPFNVFRYRTMPPLSFEPITLLCGGNGCGKSTVLNVIAEKLGVKRGAPYNRSSFFEDYLGYCDYAPAQAFTSTVLKSSRLITSDDVFDYLLNIRCLNAGVDLKREALLESYTEAKYARFQLRSMEDYDALKWHNDAKRKTGSAFVRDRLMQNVREQSNGESALMYFTQEIKENALYLLDEPENSLSAAKQRELASYLTESARFYGCQFIISTHSPFLLSLPGAKVYDLDVDPPRARRWTELENVRLYYGFFREHANEFASESENAHNGK